MLSDGLRRMADVRWSKALPDLGKAGPALASAIAAEPDGDMQALLALAYGTLPISDAAGVPFSVIRGFCEHALFLRENSPFCRNIPEDMFLHFVWYPRVNSEDLTDCRAFFYERLASEAAGLDAEAAILAVNRWCARHMAYQSTDQRTESPMTAYRTGTGRCGEESVFLVTALRSVGIPARQVYVPWWAHCDDNHAWVEAWDGGRWRFLGACEPEPVLDRGWFCDAAARAPLVHYRTFFDCRQGDPLAEINGSVRLYSVTDRYAQTGPVTVRVLGPDGKPAAGAEIELDVLNMAAFRPILRGRCDENGRFRATVGLCDLLAEAFSEGLTASALVRPSAASGETVLTLGPPSEGTVDMDLDPAPPSARNRVPLTAAQQAETAALLADCAAARAARARGWHRPEYDRTEPPWPRFFALAAGNGPEIWRFYAAHEGPERALAAEMLASMAEKDLRDATFEVLEGHLQAALPCAGAEHFAAEVLNPRIGLEPLENWRPAILAALTDDQKSAYRAHPEALMEHIQANYPAPAGSRYPALSMTPVAIISSGLADEIGRKTLFVAALRTLGVPARLDPSDGSALYWRDGAYHPADGCDAGAGAVLLSPSEGEQPAYGKDWSLARLKGDRWRVLDLAVEAGPWRLRLPSGHYRLVTTRRLPSGRQLVRLVSTFVPNGAGIVLPRDIREGSLKDMQTLIPLEKLQLWDIGLVTPGTSWDKTGVYIFLRPGAEPSEHTLLELADAAPALRARMDKGLVLSLVFRTRLETKSPNLRRVLEALPGARVLMDPDGQAEEKLARQLFLEPGDLPLLALIDSRHRGRFASAGYRVGAVDLAIRLADLVMAEAERNTQGGIPHGEDTV